MRCLDQDVRSVIERGFISRVEMCSKPPLGFQVLQEPHKRRRAEFSSAHIWFQESFSSEKILQIAILLDGLGPIVGEEDVWG